MVKLAYGVADHSILLGKISSQAKPTISVDSLQDEKRELIRLGVGTYPRIFLSFKRTLHQRLQCFLEEYQ